MIKEILNNKFYHIPVFFFLAILFFIFVFLPSVKKINTDFPNYYVSANMFLDNKDLKNAYDNVEFNKQVLLYGIENRIVSFVPYPPVNALLMIPFARLEPLTVKLLWNILNIFFFLLSAYFISKISGLNFFITGVLFFISGYAFANNFFFGQAYILVLLLLTSSLYFHIKGRDVPAALLFSVSVLLKFYTVFFLVLFLCRKKFKFIVTSIVFILLLNIIVFTVTGADINLFYYTKIMPRISDGWVGTVYASEFQSAVSMLHTMFYLEPSLNPNPLLESQQLYFILKYFFYFGILFSSAFIVTYSNNEASRNIFNLQISLFCFMCMLLLPVNASYQYVILIPAIAILVNLYTAQEKYFTILITLILFFIMNSPAAVFLINFTKNKPYFFVGYIKFFTLLYFWISNLIILKKQSLGNSIPKASLLRYSFSYVFLVLVFSEMSLALTDRKQDRAENILANPGYLISMPSALNTVPDKIIFTECRDDKFILNSDFGISFDKENIFEPVFFNKSNNKNEIEIAYETITGEKKQFKLLDINTMIDRNTDTDTPAENIIAGNDGYSHDRLKRCYSENGQIYLQDFSENKITQLTYGNSFNTRPVFSGNDSRIVFCSDRYRGVGFTALYEVTINTVR